MGKLRHGGKAGAVGVRISPPWRGDGGTGGMELGGHHGGTRGEAAGQSILMQTELPVPVWLQNLLSAMEKGYRVAGLAVRSGGGCRAAGDAGVGVWQRGGDVAVAGSAGWMCQGAARGRCVWGGCFRSGCVMGWMCSGWVF